MDEALEGAAHAAGIRWVKSKGWKGRQGRHLGGSHARPGTPHEIPSTEAKAAWEMVRRLSRLPGWGKRKIAAQQLLPLLTYGSFF